MSPVHFAHAAFADLRLDAIARSELRARPERGERNRSGLPGIRARSWSRASRLRGLHVGRLCIGVKIVQNLANGLVALRDIALQALIYDRAQPGGDRGI